MKRNVFLILSLIFLISCNVTSKLSTIKWIDGFNYYEQASPQMKIQLLGDYYFHPFKKKYSRDINLKFIVYATLRIDSKKSKILYTANTTVKPFYSTLCLQYKTSLPDTLFLNAIKTQLNEYLHIKIPEVKRIFCCSKDVYKLRYQKTNPVNKVYTSHTEYFFRNNEYIYRFFFWTTDSEDAVISTEAESIIKKIIFN